MDSFVNPFASDKASQTPQKDAASHPFFPSNSPPLPESQQSWSPQHARPRYTPSYGEHSTWNHSTSQFPSTMDRSSSIQSAPAATSMYRSFSNVSAASNNSQMNFCDANSVQGNIFGQQIPWATTDDSSYLLSSTMGHSDVAFETSLMSHESFERSEFVPQQFDINASNMATDYDALNPQNLELLSVQNRLGKWAYQSPKPSTPTTGELTFAPTLSTEMSRQSSVSALGAPFQGLNVNVPVQDGTLSLPQSAVSPFSPFPESGQGAALVSLSSSPGDDVYTSSPAQFLPGVVVAPDNILSVTTEGMERSFSNQSSCSSTAQSRASQRHQETLAQGSRPIAPKQSALESTNGRRRSSSDTLEPANIKRRASDNDVDSLHSHASSANKIALLTKNQSSKAYTRPQHPKILCPHCSKYPNGFRGEHELRRHYESTHATVRKVWITVDASESKTYLSSCKQCRNQKQYGAYYNAAAHLRRAHFHPRKRGRKSRNDSEKRGGKGGGNDPPMEHLKQFWMKEIEVFGPKTTANEADDSIEDDDQEPAQEAAADISPVDTTLAFDSHAVQMTVQYPAKGHDGFIPTSQTLNPPYDLAFTHGRHDSFAASTYDIQPTIATGVEPELSALFPGMTNPEYDGSFDCSPFVLDMQ